jgi:hypothetical protein
MATTPEQNLADVRDLAPGVRARAAEIESHRRRPTDRVAALRALGVFRMARPSCPSSLHEIRVGVLHALRVLRG